MVDLAGLARAVHLPAVPVEVVVEAPRRLRRRQVNEGIALVCTGAGQHRNKQGHGWIQQKNPEQIELKIIPEVYRKVEVVVFRLDAARCDLGVLDRAVLINDLHQPCSLA